jgi:tRNA(fMet)-specific endonuclease VapC
MIMFDTDTLTLYFNGRAQIQQRLDSADEDPVVSIVSRIEVLRGRFDSVLKAENADALLRAQQWLAKAEEDLAKYTIVSFDIAAGNEFERLRQNKKLKKIGRNDVLIACIALANRATLVTRNVKDFELVPGLRLENWAD